MLKGYIPSEIIEEIKLRTNIVDVVSEYVSLKKTGRNFVGLCPFHKEKTPSFSVNPEKQIFYCFGCGEGGNAISFLMKLNDMSFPQTIRHLAAKAGIAIPDARLQREDKGALTEKEQLIRINRMAADFFSRNLTSDGGKHCREYLSKRGMDLPVIQKFGLGYSPDGWRHLKKYLHAKGVPPALSAKAGLIIIKDTGQSYDRFRGRVMFPIVDLGGHVVAFGGRVIGDEEPKYLNSPESPVYVKGKTLYGLYQAKTEIKKKNEVVIVEGYLDFLSLWSQGIRNVVATLGTALTKDQVELVRRFTRNVAVIFDPDAAGRSAVERSLHLFLEEEMHAKVISLPDGYDPDQYVRKFGQAALESIISGAPPMVDYYIDTMMGTGTTLEEKLDAVKNSIFFISNIRNLIERNLFIKRVSEKIDIDQKLLKDEINKARRKVAARPVRGAGISGERQQRIDSIELDFIHLMMEYPDAIPVAVENSVLDCFMYEELRVLGQSLVESYRNGRPKKVTDVIHSLDNGALKTQLMERAMHETPFNAERIDRELGDRVKKIKLRWYEAQRRTLQKQLMEAQNRGDRELCERLVVEKGRLLNEEKALKKHNITSTTHI